MARIVVADDDADIRELVEFKLATLGHDIVTVGDGSAAVDACRTQHPDLAVLDIMMPGLTGLEAVKEMRANPEMAGIPVILLTARAQQSDVQIGYDSGADDYITKPFSPKDLAARVEALLAAELSIAAPSEARWRPERCETCAERALPRSCPGRRRVGDTTRCGRGSRACAWECAMRSWVDYL